MNEHVRNNKYFATAKEFRCAIDNFFINILPSLGDTLGSRINDNFQVLKSASWSGMGIYPTEIETLDLSAENYR